MRRENLREREQAKDELAHYAKRCVDLEYKFPMGWSELEGIANRTDYDLKAHSRSPENPDAVGELQLLRPGAEEAHRPLRDRAVGGRRSRDAGVPVRRVSTIAGQGAAGRGVGQAARAGVSFAKSVDKKDPKAFDPEAKARLVAAAEKIAAGLPGTLPELLALSDDEAADKIEVFKKVRGVSEKLGEEFTRTVLHLHPRLAPIKVAVFPLKKNEPRLVELARGVKKDLQAAGLRAVYDDTGAIGKLYRRQDEIGTPFCITVDFQSLEDKTVTVRDRDTMAQERVGTGELGAALRAKVG